MQEVPKPRTKDQILADFEALRQKREKYLEEKKFTEASQVLQDIRGLEQELQALEKSQVRRIIPEGGFDWKKHLTPHTKQQ